MLATTEALALGRVSVRIARASAAHLPIASMPLDLTRYFEFSGLAAGKYIVSVAADGLDSRTYDISAPTVAVGFATVHGGSSEARYVLSRTVAWPVTDSCMCGPALGAAGNMSASRTTPRSVHWMQCSRTMLPFLLLLACWLPSPWLWLWPSVSS